MQVTVEGRQGSKNWGDEFLDFDLVFFGLINTNPGFYFLLFVSCFEKGDFQKEKFNLFICNFELPSAFCLSYSKNKLFCVKLIAFL